MLLLCLLTAFSVMNIRLAMAALDRPSAIMARTIARSIVAAHRGRIGAVATRAAG
jgi:hypothetical protein